MNGIPSILVKINQMFIITTVTLGILINHHLLLLPIIIGIITISTKKNPIISFSFRYLRKDLATYTLEDKDQQIFNQWIATVLISIQFICFVLSYETLGILFGCIVLIASSFALAGFCIGCVVRYKYIQMKHNNKNKPFFK
ncbi:hypothetical protein CIB95_06960 [Lottiidibacillus patelloidae]|uniref:DUF4395 domain-containing protein n=1 Tax=Lottiidibacillus patelloidae TaxID=2670334 RepID=A0A263BU04_9BACI|nr:DUF4395 family protein [Lottiidibacillus patelloidae]OZM57199.1 hypothetical protein CIB95_06960 [Lottiidibacillus patelloidae]